MEMKIILGEDIGLLKSYYTIAEIKRMLNEKRIRSTEECMNDLINNHQLHAQQRRTIKTDK